MDTKQIKKITEKLLCFCIQLGYQIVEFCQADILKFFKRDIKDHLEVFYLLYSTNTNLQLFTSVSLQSTSLVNKKKAYKSTSFSC